METIVKDVFALGKLGQLSYSKKFAKFDEGGKEKILGIVFSGYYNQEKMNLTNEEREFAETLRRSVGISGIWALLTTVEGSKTYSRNRGCTIFNAIKETDRILSDSEYRKLVGTPLKRSWGTFEIIKEQSD